MALFKILKGSSSRIDTSITPYNEGYAYFTPDDGGFYIDAEVDKKGKRIRINEPIDNQSLSFKESPTLENITSGEKLSTLFGKIMKWFADLKTVAFTGSYSDLSGKPTIPAAVRVKGNAESEYRTGDVNITADNIGIEIGGRNLLIRGDAEKNATASATGASGIMYTLSDYGVNLLNVVGTKIAVSFDAKISTPVSTSVAARIRGTSDSTNLSNLLSIQKDLTTEWKRFSGTLTISGEGAGILRIIVSANEAKPTLYVKNAKVEIGTLATDWTPAPEDLVYTLPTATPGTLGGIKIGSTMSISDGAVDFYVKDTTTKRNYTISMENGVVCLDDGG